jgi:hypothetical protein
MGASTAGVFVNALALRDCLIGSDAHSWKFIGIARFALCSLDRPVLYPRSHAVAEAHL